MIFTRDIIINLIFTAIGAIIGYFINNKLAITRDKRREFNDLVNPMRQTLMLIRNQPSSRWLKETSEINFALIREKLPFWKRNGFDIAIENYKKSTGTENYAGSTVAGVIYKNKEFVIQSIDNLLEYVKPK